MDLPLLNPYEDYVYEKYEDLSYLVAAKIPTPGTTTLAPGTVYPNPSYGGLSIADEFEAGVVQLQLYSMEGKLLLEQQEEAIGGPQRFSLDARGVSAGIYLLRLVEGKRESVYRVVLL